MVANVNKVDKKEVMLGIMLSMEDFIIADFETTGLSPDKGARIIEIGAVKIKKGKIVDRYQQFIYPEQKIYAKIIELTGITNEMLVGKPLESEVLPGFYEWMEGLPFVAHNAMFDWDRFLKPSLQKLGIASSQLVVCTKVVANAYLELANGKLSTLCGYYDVEIENHHRAIDDAVALAKAFLLMKEELSSEKEELHSVYSQMDLFGNEPSKEMQSFKVSRVSYWEKKVGKNTMNRIYVQLDIGTVFLDLQKDHWFSKDVEGNIDFQEVETRTIDFIRKKSRDELLTFRGQRSVAS
ncbi:3'-5' exonuclease [Psychrobacillus sp. FSL H8-0510]|uniref:3'-5' exonuclease n=1 Tax=Psychrobacillus sp. FSL H8-0510 TaxID=2921394 RepID=UPI0030FA7C35